MRIRVTPRAGAGVRLKGSTDRSSYQDRLGFGSAPRVWSWVRARDKDGACARARARARARAKVSTMARVRARADTRARVRARAGIWKEHVRALVRV